MKTIQKYEFTGKRKVIDGVTLRQIRAAMDFYALKPYDPEIEDEVESPEGDFEFRLIKKGTLGGWLESGKNLSQEGLAWVADDACVYGEAVVSEGALVCGQAKVYGNAVVQTYSRVFDRAEVHGSTGIYGHAMVYENANIESGSAFDYAKIHGNAHMYGRGSICISDEAEICDNAKLCSTEKPDCIIVSDRAMVCGDAKVWGCAMRETTICEHAHVEGTAVIKDGARIEYSATVEGAAQIIGATVRDYATVCGETIVHAHSRIGGMARVELCKDEKGYGFTELPAGICIVGTARITTLADFMMVGPLEIPYKACGSKFVTLLFVIDREKNLTMNIFKATNAVCYHSDDDNVYHLDDEEEMAYLLRRKYGELPGLIDAVWKAAEYAKAHLSGRLAELAGE